MTGGSVDGCGLERNADVDSTGLARGPGGVLVPRWPYPSRIGTYTYIEGHADHRQGHASIVGNDRVVFNIGGNRYRLIIRFDYPRRIGFVRFVGTHAEYDRIDASQV